MRAVTIRVGAAKFDTPQDRMSKGDVTTSPLENKITYSWTMSSKITVQIRMPFTKAIKIENGG